MTVEELIAYRHLLQTEHERVDPESRKRASLAFQIASISESIAEEHIKAGDPTDAVWDLLTQSEYLGLLGRYSEKKEVLKKIKGLTSNDKILTWLDIMIGELPDPSNKIELNDKD